MTIRDNLCHLRNRAGLDDTKGRSIWVLRCDFVVVVLLLIIVFANGRWMSKGILLCPIGAVGYRVMIRGEKQQFGWR